MIDPVKQFETLNELLTSHKKVTVDMGKLRFYEDLNDPNSKSWASTNTKYTDIEYIYANPQHNRTFAKLVDGRTVDYDIPYMKIFWSRFIEYVPPAKPKKRLSLEQIQKELGYEIDLIK